MQQNAMQQRATQQPHAPVRPASEQLPDLFASLEQALLAQETGYRRLRELVNARREAIRTANLELLRTTLDEERTIVSRIAELDRQRTDVANRIAKKTGDLPATPATGATGAKSPAASAPALPPVTTLCQKAPQPLRERLLALASRLRVEIEAVRHESSLVRTAADTLAQHVAGVLQSVSSAFAGTKTYGRAGRVATAGAIRSIDLKS